MSTDPTIDVVVPAFNEADHIEDCLDHLLAQDYPPELVRVWVVDAGSSDETAAIVTARAEREPRLRLIGGAERLNAGQAVNLGAAAGDGELIARVDAHTYVAPDYLRRAVEAFDAAEPDVACVGGQPQQVGRTPFGDAVAAARGSKLGVGGSIYADHRERAFVYTVQAGVYRRTVFESLDGFDPDIPYGEDEELNWRLRDGGGRILLDTRLRFKYFTRSSWSALFRQYRNYGESRVRVVVAHREFLQPYHLAPAALLLAFASLTAAAPASRPARRGLAGLAVLYGGALLAGGAQASGETDSTPAPRVAAAIAAMHLGYGVGMLEGVANQLRVRARLGTPAASVRPR
jgi:glycosyltransferase involved in cell wall biosynthesis